MKTLTINFEKKGFGLDKKIFLWYILIGLWKTQS